MFTLFEKVFLEVLRMRATINEKIWVKRNFCAGIIQLVFNESRKESYGQSNNQLL